MKKILINGKKYNITGTHKNVGDVADNFSVINNDLESVNFYDISSGIRIVSSCVSIDAPVCEMQIKRLNAEIYISTQKIDTFTITADLPMSQSKFEFEQDISYLTLLSDHQKLDFGIKYGVLIEELRLLTRAIFVVDKDNIIRYAEYVTDNEKQFNYIKAISIAKQLIKK